MRPRGWPAIVPVLLLVFGCAPQQANFEPKLSKDIAALGEELDLLPAFSQPQRASGSLWTDSGPGMALVRDPRAFRLNDLVTIVLDENDSGSNEATTELDRSSTAQFGVTNAMGLEDANPVNGSFSLNNFLRASSNSEFVGDGATQRQNVLDAKITARVLRVLPNSDLVIAGQKTVVINRERQVLTLVGAIRTADINAANLVPSSSVGNLTVRLWGRGEVDDTVRQGWFMRILNRVWPF